MRLPFIPVLWLERMVPGGICVAYITTIHRGQQ